MAGLPTQTATETTTVPLLGGPSNLLPALVFESAPMMFFHSVRKMAVQRVFGRHGLKVEVAQPPEVRPNPLYMAAGVGNQNLHPARNRIRIGDVGRTSRKQAAVATIRAAKRPAPLDRAHKSDSASKERA
jgi:hypothetical protein